MDSRMTYAGAKAHNATLDPKSVYPMATVPLTYEDTGTSHDPIFGYTCIKCGKHAATTFVRPTAEKMVERGLCFYCNYDVDLAEQVARDHSRLTIIDGHLYTPGNATTGEFRGMAGRRFDIEYIEPSVWAGHKITTFDLWSGPTMPDELRAKYSDTARFLNGAHKAQIGDTTCWDDSDYRAVRFPLPNALPGGGPK